MVLEVFSSVMAHFEAMNRMRKFFLYFYEALASKKVLQICFNPIFLPLLVIV